MNTVEILLTITRILAMFYYAFLFHGRRASKVSKCEVYNSHGEEIDPI